MSEDVEQLYRAAESSGRQLPGSAPGVYKSHLLIPIHPPKFGFLGTAFAKLNDVAPSADTLITLLVTSKLEREILENYIELSGFRFPGTCEVVSAIEVCNWLDLPEVEHRIRSNSDNGIVNFKKVLGLYRAACAGADEILCIDIDVVFLVDPSRVFQAARENYAKKVVIAGFSGIGRDIMKACAAFFDPEDEARLLEMTQDSWVYNWFFDAPYYPREDLLKFFSYVSDAHGGLTGIMKKLNWLTFEHTLFQYYLMLRGEFSLIDIRPVTGPRVTDDLWLSEIIAVEQSYGYRPVWAALGALITYVTPEQLAFNKERFLMAMHVDRVPGRPYD